jgi:hypothetical protein
MCGRAEVVDYSIHGGQSFPNALQPTFVDLLCCLT